MGTGLLLMVIVLAIAIAFWRPLHRVRTALAVSHLVATGHVFLLIGYFAGGLVEERPTALLDDLRPVVAFVAGWVGFAAGMRFEVRVLRAVPATAYGVALLPAIAAAVVVGCTTAVALVLTGTPPVESLGGALVTAAAAASSGPTLAAIVRTRRAGQSPAVRPVLRMIELSAGIDDIVVIVLALLAFAWFQPGGETSAPGALLLFGAAGGALLGLVTWLFLGGRAQDSERLLLGLAMLAFIAGFGGWLNTSPAGVSAIAAIVLVNLPGRRMTLLFDAVRRVERPAVVILMTVIGFHLTGPVHWVFFPIFGALTLLRLGAKVWSADFVSGAIPGAPGLSVRPGWGYGLVPQGILGLMVALTFFHVWDDAVARSVLAATAAAGLANEMISPWLIVRTVRLLTGSTAAVE